MTVLETPDWVEPRDYQQEAVHSWIDSDAQGVLQMATGTGKTVTSLLAAAHISQSLDGNLALLVAVPYQHLVDQWADDVRDFGGAPVLAYESRARWQEDLEGEIVEFNRDASDGFVVITTHTTFGSDEFQRMIGRLRRPERMLIGDEIHHMGAPHLRRSLPEDIQLRLGLSATPERFYDEEGTEELFGYFGGIAFEYMLQEAIKNGVLCEYYYVPHVIELTDEEADTYLELSKKIARLIDGDEGGGTDAELEENSELKFALFERARLVGTAQNKLVRLVELLKQENDVHHTLVYCGDGTVEGAVANRTQRHVDAAVSTLRGDLGIRAERFTAEENRSERQELLDYFEAGDVEVLVAIRCLDEGVDVPATETAYMLASSSNPRQFVQRRGRILRTHPGKSHAIIHDFIVAPPMELRQLDENDRTFTTERNLVRKELQRVNLFAEAARNHPDADIPGIPTEGGAIGELKRGFNLRNL